MKRTRDGVEALEHALRGVHTSDNRQRIITFDQNPGFVRASAIVQVDVMDDQPVEHEVIVHLAADRPRRQRRAR